ncbi:MAG TPA: YIP1 family protein [Thermodesulfobacteriota bacterium]|nr:YIP1 family protein [Thermodesulfobacteriota bacterium]
MFINRVIRAIRLDAQLYEEVEADKGSIWQAMLVVVLVSVAAGIGSIGVLGIDGIIVGTLLDLIGWFLWALLTYVIGVKLFPEPQTESDLGELLRVIGFARSPGIFLVLMLITAAGRIIALFITIWMFVAMVIGVRQALDYKSTWRAAGVCILGAVIYFVINVLVNAFFANSGHA